MVLLFLCLSACSKKESEALLLDSTEPKALEPDVEWAVITSPYASFRQNHDWDSKVIAHGRKGEVILITGKTSNALDNLWYNTDKGWLPKSSVSVYSNRLKAKTVADKMTEGVND